jgi:CheY-like chemotaxis protein
MARITVVDDNQEFLGLLRDLFDDRFEVSTVAQVTSVNHVADTTPDVMIVDLHTNGTNSGLTGWQLVELARRHRDLRRVPIIVCTGDLTGLMRHGDELTAHDNVHLLAKPFELEVIEGLVGRLVRTARTRDQTLSAS